MALSWKCPQAAKDMGSRGKQLEKHCGDRELLDKKNQSEGHIIKRRPAAELNQ